MRLRITFSKSGSLRYTGHLDLQVVWERTVRRASLPLSYTQGFHPGPKIQIACALPLGFLGSNELVDIWLDSPTLDLDNGALARLQTASPPGLGILALEVVDEHGPALQTQVLAAVYQVILLDPVDASGLAERVALFHQAETLPRERRGKPYDLKPLVEDLQLHSTPGSVLLSMRLAARDGATGRPEEVLACLDIPLENTRIERTRLVLK